MNGSFQEAFGWGPASPVIAATFAGTTVELPGSLHPSKIRALTSVRKGEAFDLSSA